MGKRSSFQDDSPQPPAVTPTVGIGLLRRQIDRGKDLLTSDSIQESQYEQWHTLTENCVVKSFGDSSTHHYTFLTAGPRAKLVMGHQDPNSSVERRGRREKLTSKLETLETLIQVLNIEIEVNDVAAVNTVPTLRQSVSRRIFLVHGHDHQARSDVARFVEKTGIEVVILDEKPTQGRTIPEQLETYGDVGFAIVLLTPDDRGGSIKQPLEEYQARARQNAMLELGYFWGRLGRSRVCALYVTGVEIPSDFHGVLFTSLDSNDRWKQKVFQELTAAGLNPSSDVFK